MSLVNELAHFTFGVIQIAEDASIRRATGNTEWLVTFLRTFCAEIAFRHYMINIIH